MKLYKRIFVAIWCVLLFKNGVSHRHWVESVSLITTGKNSRLLFDSVLSHFTFDWKYFYIWIILGVSSFKWYDHGLSTSYYGGDISGLRSRTPSVVIKCSFLNYDGKPNFFPNNDILRKFKQKCIFFGKTFFLHFLIGKQGKVSLAML
jgi:hypothetical protein